MTAWGFWAHHLFLRVHDKRQFNFVSSLFSFTECVRLTHIYPLKYLLQNCKIKIAQEVTVTLFKVAGFTKVKINILYWEMVSDA